MYRIPLENEQITKALTTPYAPANYNNAEKGQFRENIGTVPLTLEEIKATTQLDGKVASAQAVKAIEEITKLTLNVTNADCSIDYSNIAIKDGILYFELRLRFTNGVSDRTLIGTFNNWPVNRVIRFVAAGAEVYNGKMTKYCVAYVTSGGQLNVGDGSTGLMKDIAITNCVRISNT